MSYAYSAGYGKTFAYGSTLKAIAKQKRLTFRADMLPIANKKDDGFHTPDA